MLFMGNEQVWYYYTFEMLYNLSIDSHVKTMKTQINNYRQTWWLREPYNLNGHFLVFLTKIVGV